MEKLTQLADELSALTKEELSQLATLLHRHPGNNEQVGIMAVGDPVPPSPTHPPTP